MTQNEKIDKIYETLIGNEELRQKGLIERIEDLEKKAGVLDMFWAKVTGGVMVLSLIGAGLFSFVFWLYNKVNH